jgi:hypothetical protein
MLFGHNTNLSVDGNSYHVQTEDRGAETALIDTTVFCRGRVLHRRTNNYFDLLPLNADKEGALKLRLDEQHRLVVEEIRSGKLHPALPPNEAKPGANAPASAKPGTTAPAAPSSANREVGAPKGIALELTNPRTWLTGKRATLQVSVRNQENGNPVAGAKVAAKVDGSAEPFEVSLETGLHGQALLEFEMPRLSGAEPALVIEATKGALRSQLRFQLKSKPRVPTT